MHFSSPHLTIISRSQSHDDGYDGYARNVDQHGGRNGHHLAARHCFPSARDSGVHQVSPLLSPTSGAIRGISNDDLVSRDPGCARSRGLGPGGRGHEWKMQAAQHEQFLGSRRVPRLIVGFARLTRLPSSPDSQPPGSVPPIAGCGRIRRSGSRWRGGRTAERAPVG